MINTLWFIILALMLTMYAVLDGFDLGVGALHLWVGRNDDERGRGDWRDRAGVERQRSVADRVGRGDGRRLSASLRRRRSAASIWR